MNRMQSTKTRFFLGWRLDAIDAFVRDGSGSLRDRVGPNLHDGTSKGVVTDPSGRVVPNADVRVTNERTNEVRTVKTGADGAYTVPLLPPGVYRVDIDAKGFARATVSPVVIAVTETNVTNVSLKVGSESTTVEVKATPPLVEINTIALGDVVTTAQVEALPLVNRNFTQIITLSAGVIASVTDAAELGRGSGGQIPTTEGQGENVEWSPGERHQFSNGWG